MWNRARSLSWSVLTLAAALPVALPGASAAQDAPLQVRIITEGATGPRFTISKPAYVAVIEVSGRSVRAEWPIGSGDDAQWLASGGRRIDTEHRSTATNGTVVAGSNGATVSATPSGGIVRPTPRGWIVIASSEPLAFKNPSDAEQKVRDAMAKLEEKRELSLDDRLSTAMAVLATARAAEVASDRFYSDGRSTRVGGTATRVPPVSGDPCDPKRRPKDKVGESWWKSQCGDVGSTEVPKPTALPKPKVPGA